MSNWRSRSADEREAARLERERRRAARDVGGNASEVGDSASDGVGSRGERAGRPSVGGELPRLPPGPEPQVSSRVPAAVGTADSLSDSELEPELPSGIRRAYPAPRGSRTGRIPRRTGAGQPRRHSTAGRVLAGLALLLAAVLIWFLIELFQPFHGPGQGNVTVTIPAHTSSTSVGDLLERDGVVSSGFFFGVRAFLSGERSSLRAGTYHLRRGMSYGDALAVLTAVPPAAKVTDLTIIEGKARTQVDSLLRSQGIRGSYLAATRRSPLLDPRSYGAASTTSTLEGFLFPSTYQLREPISLVALANDQLIAFRRSFGNVDLGYARRQLHLTPFDVLTVASMIQGEAQTAGDRPLIASVIYNRMRAQMPLQIDATVRFASDNYTTPITASQLRASSPYNTYVHRGLPPGPIDSPGLASIEAAAHPATTNFLYFVVKPCGNGEHAFASTYAQFLAEVNQYQTARTKRGGRSPANC